MQEGCRAFCGHGRSPEAPRAHHVELTPQDGIAGSQLRTLPDHPDSRSEM